jgi:tetratricopeptide (TPR) repeat protein
MYLRGSKWSMARKRKRRRPLLIIVLIVMVAGAAYVDRFIVPTTPPLFIPTPTPTRSPDSFLNEASDLIQKGKINQAIETYKEAVKADPRNPAVYVTLARWQVLYGDYQGATDNVQNALLLNPNHALAMAVRGWILGLQGDSAAGQVEIEKSLEIDPNSALAYAYLAEIYKIKLESGKEDINTRDQIGAISKKALELDSSLLEVHRARGLVLEVTGNYNDAITELETAVSMNENLADLHLALGRNYNAAEIYDKAEYEFGRAIALKPDDSEAYAELSRMYLKLGQFGKGTQYSEQAVQKDPKDPYLRSLVGSFYYKTGDYKAAITSLRLAVNGGMSDEGVQVEPIALDNSIASINLFTRYGISLAKANQCGEALKVSQKMSEVVGDNEDAMYNAQVIIDTCKQLADNQPTPEPSSAPETDATSTPAP